MQASEVNLGTNLKLLRKNNGFTQEQLADHLGIGRVTLAHYESGERQPPIATLEKLATLYGVAIADLFEPTDDTLVLNAAFAFRAAGDFQPADLEHIASFRRIVSNYLKMKRLDSAE